MRTHARLFSKALWETGICLFLGAGPVLAAGLPMPESLDRRGLDRFFDNAAGFGRFEPLAATPAPQAPPQTAGIEYNGTELPRVAFPENGSVSKLLVDAIDHTEASLKLILYDFNLQEVLEALQRARDRNPPVQIQLVLDESHVFPSKPGAVPSPQMQALLKDPKIQVRIVRGFDYFGIMHNKIAIFDGKLVEHGSFNWTNAAEKRNHENALFTTDPHRVGMYQLYWDWLWKNAQSPDKPHGPPTLTPGPPRDQATPVRFQNTLFPAVVFSPHGGTSQWLIKAIHKSKSTIDVAMFSFYHQGIADALLERKQKGVKIRLILDKGQTRNSPVVAFLKEEGFDMRITAGRPGGQGMGVMHNKFGIFDGEMVETGSYNWSNNAENNNFEDTNFITDPPVISAFQGDFETIWGASEQMSPQPAPRTPLEASADPARDQQPLPFPNL
ncbi:MAG: phospholipase D-like domain-containing protein [Elusimicrobiota bacterium]